LKKEEPIAWATLIKTKLERLIPVTVIPQKRLTQGQTQLPWKPFLLRPSRVTLEFSLLQPRSALIISP